MKNPYTILGVERNATQDDIKKAYKKLAKQYHPDINPNGKEKFAEIQEAYETITNRSQNNPFDNSQYAPDIDIDKIFGRFNFRPEIVKVINISVNLTLEEIHYGCDKIIQLDDTNSTKTKISIPAGSDDYCNFSLNVENLKYKIRVNINPILNDGFYITNGILHKKVEMSARQFLEADSLEVSNHLGSKFNISLKPSISTGSLIRLPNKGLYNSEKNKETDLLIQLVIRKGE